MKVSALVVRRLPPSGAEHSTTDTLLKPFTDLIVKALGSVGKGASHSLNMLDELNSSKDGAKKSIIAFTGAAKVMMQVVKDGASLALIPNNSKTRFKNKPGWAKKVARYYPIPLDEIRAIGKALNFPKTMLY